MKIWHPGYKTSQGDKWNEQILISDKLKYMHIDCVFVRLWKESSECPICSFLYSEIILYLKEKEQLEPGV